MLATLQCFATFDCLVIALALISLGFLPFYFLEYGGRVAIGRALAL